MYIKVDVPIDFYCSHTDESFEFIQVKSVEISAIDRAINRKLLFYPPLIEIPIRLFSVIKLIEVNFDLSSSVLFTLRCRDLDVDRFN